MIESFGSKIQKQPHLPQLVLELDQLGLADFFQTSTSLTTMI